MYYELTIELDKPNTIITLYTIYLYTNKEIIRQEYVYGANTFFDILFYLSQKSSIVIVPSQTKYVIRFLWERSAQGLYDSIMDYIRDSESCEIL